MFNNFLCADAFAVGFLIFDGVLILAAVGLFIWFILKTRTRTNVSKTQETSNPISKVDDETYVIETPKEEETAAPVYENDNEVVHFINQISDINEDAKNELNANTVVVNHEVEIPVKKAVTKEEIANFIEVAGEKQPRVEAKNANRGTDAFKNSTNFINTIKAEQSSENLSSKKVAKKK